MTCPIFLKKDKPSKYLDIEVLRFMESSDIFELRNLMDERLFLSMKSVQCQKRKLLEHFDPKSHQARPVY